MNARAQLLVGVLFCGLAFAVEVWGLSNRIVCIGLALSLAAGVALPRVTLRLLLLTASCDLALTVRVADAFTLRFAHFCGLLLLARLAITRLRLRGGWRPPRRALQPLALYLGVAVLSAVRSQNLGKTVGYLGWAAFDVLAVFLVILEVARHDQGFRFATRWWVAGAGMAAAMGLVQLGLGLAHQSVPLLQQWMGPYPRINGFNYEPAYFSLYLESVAAPLLIYGLVARRSGLALLGGSLMVPAALSMSRSGWLGISVVVVYALARLVVARRWSAATGLGMGAAATMAGLIVALPPGFTDEAPRMAAMALDAKEVSSSAPRLDMLSQGRRVFEANPALGVGLGGYGGYVMAHPDLVLASQVADPDKVVTTNLWLELAAETGVVGVLAVVWFLAALLSSLGAVAVDGPPEERARAEAFLVGIVLVFAILYQFNQTLWRLDVWVLLALAWSVPVRAALARRTEPEMAVG